MQILIGGEKRSGDDGRRKTMCRGSRRESMASLRKCKSVNRPGASGRIIRDRQKRNLCEEPEYRAQNYRDKYLFLNENGDSVFLTYLSELLK